LTDRPHAFAAGGEPMPVTGGRVSPFIPRLRREVRGAGPAARPSCNH
jgi:hypothetical protein